MPRPSAATVAELKAALAGIPIVDDPAMVRLKSRDFFWYSPILKAELRGKAADLVVVPRDEADVLRVARECVARRVPVTVRGGGTGNYGQMVPLAGGVLLDLSGMSRILWLKPGVGRFEAGARLIDIDSAAVPTGWELRMHPSTRRMSTIGGFVAGGSGGIGSIRYGQLRDPGNVLGLRVVTMEDTPRAIELRGADVAKALHAYGTNGIITEVEMPLAPAWPWSEAIVAFDDLMDAARFAQSLGESPGIVTKLITLIAAPIAAYFKPLRDALPEGKHVVFVMVATASLEPFRAHAADAKGVVTLERPALAPGETGEAPLYEYTWNHTTLQVLKVDKSVTYLQTVLVPGQNLVQLEHLYRKFGDETMMHCEFQRRPQGISCSALQVVRYTTAKRLQEIIDYHNAYGTRISNPHTYILEDKGPKVVDGDHQLAFKHQADPHGLMNPGKMSRWSPNTG
ncbi:MAG: FAD-binding oxidoreductase [Alphaproteobacteria bacterium]|nr:FAD-binding oxidoreductase [Alphaproteobacteria bacterium]